MYIKRALSRVLRIALTQFPAVLITGPRQSGKTTFLLEEFGDKYQYVTFDDPLARAFATDDPNGFLDQFRDHPVILDEIQYVPSLFPYLKIRIDRERRKTGRWLLTGSQQFALMKNVSESLAGRIALLELFPFSSFEYQPQDSTLENQIWLGSYPEPVLEPSKRDLWMRSYLQTYVERDIRQLHNVKDLGTFEAFLALCASRHGQPFNKATFARECGVSEPTIRTWGDVLAASYVLLLLSPYFKNYGKRLNKTPKLYFLDSGLVCTLTRQPNGQAALSGLMGGFLLEGWVVNEAAKILAMHGLSKDMYFWRSHDGRQVDLILRIGPKVYPIEVKLTATPNLNHTEPLQKFKKLAGNDAATKGFLVCRVNRRTVLPGDNEALPWQEFPQWLHSQVKRS